MDYITAMQKRFDVLRLKKAPLFNMSPMLVQTKVLITAISIGKVEPFSSTVGIGALVRALACGAGVVNLLRRARTATSVVAFAINPQSNFSAHPSAS